MPRKVKRPSTVSPHGAPEDLGSTQALLGASVVVVIAIVVVVIVVEVVDVSSGSAVSVSGSPSPVGGDLTMRTTRSPRSTESPPITNRFAGLERDCIPRT